jgi:hypothetical protein
MLPVDQHMLIGALAPRYVYVASSSEDAWAGPKKEFLASHLASEAFALYGKKGIASATPPAPDTPVGTDMNYFLREGAHDLLLSDWQCSMDAFEHVLKTSGAFSR